MYNPLLHVGGMKFPYAGMFTGCTIKYAHFLGRQNCIEGNSSTNITDAPSELVRGV